MGFGSPSRRAREQGVIHFYTLEKKIWQRFINLIFFNPMGQGIERKAQ
jgi:hypothetical protein